MHDRSPGESGPSRPGTSRLPAVRVIMKTLGLSSAAAGGSFSLGDILPRTSSSPRTLVSEARLVPEVAPPDATQDLGTLVLVHGNYWKDAVDAAVDPVDRMFLLEPLRTDPRWTEVCRRYRVFCWQYPTHEAAEVAGAALATQLADVLPARSPTADLTIVAHSLGGLVARYALQQPELSGRLKDLITLATPHHGTVLVSFLQANARIREKVGLFGLVCQRLSRRVWPHNPGLMSLAYDNHDGLISGKDIAECGALVNESLAHLNRTDPTIGRITAIMGRVRGRWLPDRNLFDQIPRWIMIGQNPLFRTLDPLVHLPSGLAMGLPVRRRISLVDLDHEGIVTSPRSVEIVCRLLLEQGDVSSLGRFEEPDHERAIVDPREIAEVASSSRMG